MEYNRKFKQINRNSNTFGNVKIFPVLQNITILLNSSDPKISKKVSRLINNYNSDISNLSNLLFWYKKLPESTLLHTIILYKKDYKNRIDNMISIHNINKELSDRLKNYISVKANYELKLTNYV